MREWDRTLVSYGRTEQGRAGQDSYGRVGQGMTG